MKAPRPRKSLGQHFLADPNILRRIVEGAGVGPGDLVAEIGPGPGGLTRALVEGGADVWAVEADARMVEHLRSQDLPRLRVFQGDALETDFVALAREAGGRFRLVANLPYNISGPLIARLLRQRAAFVSLTVMLQREVAERLLAEPGSRARGILSALSQVFCQPHPLFRLGPGAFRPPPKVESMVIRLDVLDAPVKALMDEEALWTVVRTAFGKRRKMLRNSLAGVCANPEAVLRDAELAETLRPEALSSEAWISLANAWSRSRQGGEA